MPNQEAPTVAKLLVEEFVVRFGVPRQLHSDQGRNFESAVFGEMSTARHRQDQDYSPEISVRWHGRKVQPYRTQEDMLSKFVAQNQRDWDEHLPFVMMACRSSVHETTGCSPSELMLGRELRLPIDLLFSGLGRRPSRLPQSTLTSYKNEWNGHDFARETLKIESDRQKRRYDHRVGRCLYSAGDAVWLYNPRRKKGVTPKLQRPWEGPYLVTNNNVI